MSLVSSKILEEAKYLLEKRIDGEIKLDEASRKLYSTDASIYEIEPLGVVFPRTQKDLQATMELAHQLQIPVLPRGSGSSLAGQSVGAALIIDCTRYLNRIVEINVEDRSARVEPGLVLDQFNQQAAAYGLKYGPDPASSDRATFGGMLGNNSTGAHSIQFGMSSDNIIEMNSVLADGSQAKWGETKLNDLEKLASKDSIAANIAATSLLIREKYTNSIKENWPKSWRRASGYSINYLLPWSPSAPPMWDREGSYPATQSGSLNLAPLFVGSEGTLSITSEATIRLVPVAEKTVLGVVNFDSIGAACDAAPDLLKLKPSSIELIPQAMIRLASQVPAYSNLLGFVVDDPKAILLIEFSGSSKAELQQKLSEVPNLVNSAISDTDQNNIWKLRKVALGLLMARKGNSKPLPFIEDVAVPVEMLGDFVRELEYIFAQNKTSGEFYAHASAGCLHVRPVIDLKSNSGIHQMRQITEQVVAVAKRYGGAMSGEHGDGLARSEWLGEMFGNDVLGAFGELKLAADPNGLLNPGKITDPPPMTENLRYGPDYTADTWIPILDYSTQSNLQGAIEMCNGAGICRKEHGVMCPSFQATQDEMHSTRGRANLLRSAISGKTSTREMGWQLSKEALDLCLECKACKAECPSAVDMAKLKYEFLNEHYEHHRHPLRDHIFVNIEKLAIFSGLIRPLVNAANNNQLIRFLMDKTIGISSKRKLPNFQKPNAIDAAVQTPDLLFLSDPYLHFSNPILEKAALNVLKASGLEVRQLQILGAGRPLISKGFLKDAKQQARQLINELKLIDPEGKIPVVSVEPSEIYTLKDEFLDFFPGDEFVEALAARSFMVEEYILRNERAMPRLAASLQKNDDIQALLHGHCYQKAQPPSADLKPIGQDASAQLLRELGWKVEIIDSGCCGMAGSFGYESEHYDLSMQIAELTLFPKLRQSSSEEVVCAPGLSCRSQIEDGLNMDALHPIQLIADQLGLNPKAG